MNYNRHNNNNRRDRFSVVMNQNSMQDSGNYFGDGDNDNFDEENNSQRQGLMDIKPHHGDCPPDNNSEMVLKLRGLPWSCGVDDILKFFNGIPSVCEDGIHLVSTAEGRSSGEAFVEVSDNDMSEAIKRDKKNIGHRYIEVFKVKRAEMEWILERSSNRPNNFNMNSVRNNSDDSELYVRMRGLPFECSRDEIARFFSGLDVVAINLTYDSQGRASGECYVKFRNKEITEKALQRDRNCIGHRYIEIFRVGASEIRNQMSMVTRNNNRPPQFNRPNPYDRDRGNNLNGPNNRYGPNPHHQQQQQRPSRYFSKGFEEDTWNSYANEVQHSNWNRGGNNSGPPNRRGGGNSNANVVLMRGLPFRANENDIRKFFEPLVPMGIQIIYDSNGRPSGTAKVQFACGDDTTRAMAKHKEKIFTRYIELFINAS